MKFGDEFERRFLSQGYFERRTLEEGLDLGWEVLSLLPKEELVRIKEEDLKKHYKARQ
jgi:V/A-type H+-transporting ATPase subunit B